MNFFFIFYLSILVSPWFHFGEEMRNHFERGKCMMSISHFDSLARWPKAYFILNDQSRVWIKKTKNPLDRLNNKLFWNEAKQEAKEELIRIAVRSVIVFSFSTSSSYFSSYFVVVVLIILRPCICAHAIIVVLLNVFFFFIFCSTCFIEAICDVVVILFIPFWVHFRSPFFLKENKKQQNWSRYV